MHSEILIRRLHFVFILALTGAIFGQLLLLLTMPLLATLMARGIGIRVQ